MVGTVVGWDISSITVKQAKLAEWPDACAQKIDKNALNMPLSKMITLQIVHAKIVTSVTVLLRLRCCLSPPSV